MKASCSFVLAIAGATLVAACTPAPPPAAVEADPVAAPAASAAPSAMPAPPAAPAHTVSMRAMVGSRALAGAAVSVRLVSDLSVVAEGLTTDGEGRIALTLDSRLAPGTHVVVTAQTATSALSGIFTVPHPLTVQQAGAAPDWLLDIATSVVARKLTSKVADALRSLPPGGNADSLNALRDQVRVLVEKTREALQQDASLAPSLQAALASPTKSHLDTLATSAVMTPSLQGRFVEIVKTCNRLAYDNMAAGGPLLQPATWQVNALVVVPPQLRAEGPEQVVITYESRRVSRIVGNAAGAVSEAVKHGTDTASNPGYADFNTTITVGGGSSGSGGSGGSAPQPSLAGTISVGGAGRGSAMVQLSALSGAVIAKTATSSNGFYAFYNIPDGVYHLMVAADGAVPATQVVTIGNP